MFDSWIRIQLNAQQLGSSGVLNMIFTEKNKCFLCLPVLHSVFRLLHIQKFKQLL